MQFREATESDAEAIAATFDGNNALPLEPRVRAALPGLLRQLIASPACTLTVFEESDWAQARVVSFASGLFLRDEVIDDYLAAPYPGLISGVLAGLLDGRRPLLTLEEIRRANSGEGLTQAVFPVPLGKYGLEDAWVGQLRRLAPQAMLRDVGGYRLRAIYYEVFTDEVASYLQDGGFRLLHDFSALAGTGFLRPDSRPRMLRLTRADLPPGAMSMASQMFDPPRPRAGADAGRAARGAEGARRRVRPRAGRGAGPLGGDGARAVAFDLRAPVARDPGRQDGRAARRRCAARRRAAAGRDRISAPEHARAAPVRERLTKPWRHAGGAR